MGIKLSDIARNERSVAIKFESGVLNITYRPGGITPETEDVMNGFREQSRSGQGLVSLLVPALVSWDLLGEDGNPLPITTEILGSLPLVLLSRITTTLSEDMAPNAKRGGS